MSTSSHNTDPTTTDVPVPFKFHSFDGERVTVFTGMAPGDYWKKAEAPPVNARAKAGKDRLAAQEEYHTAAGRVPIKLCLGDVGTGMNIQVPQKALERIGIHNDHLHFGYGPILGTNWCRQAHCDLLAEVHGVRLPMENVLITSAGRGSTFHAAHAMHRPEKPAKAIVTATWGTFGVVTDTYFGPENTRALVTPNGVPLRDHMVPFFKANGDVGWMVLANPSNPCGTMPTFEEMVEIIVTCAEFDIDLYVDGMYAIYSYVSVYTCVFRVLLWMLQQGGAKAKAAEKMAHKVMMQFGLMKAIGSGMRLNGIACLDTNLLSRFGASQGRVAGPPPIVSQAVATEFFLGGHHHLAVEIMYGRVQTLLRELIAMDARITPYGMGVNLPRGSGDAAIYMGPEIKGVRNLQWTPPASHLNGGPEMVDSSEQLCTMLVDEGGITVMPAVTAMVTGQIGFTRIAVGMAENEAQVARAIQQMGDALIRVAKANGRCAA